MTARIPWTALALVLLGCNAFEQLPRYETTARTTPAPPPSRLDLGPPAEDMAAPVVDLPVVDLPVADLVDEPDAEPPADDGGPDVPEDTWPMAFRGWSQRQLLQLSAPAGWSASVDDVPVPLRLTVPETMTDSLRLATVDGTELPYDVDGRDGGNLYVWVRWPRYSASDPTTQTLHAYFDNDDAPAYDRAAGARATWPSHLAVYHGGGSGTDPEPFVLHDAKGVHDAVDADNARHYTREPGKIWQGDLKSRRPIELKIDGVHLDDRVVWQGSLAFSAWVRLTKDTVDDGKRAYFFNDFESARGDGTVVVQQSLNFFLQRRDRNGTLCDVLELKWRPIDELSTEEYKIVEHCLDASVDITDGRWHWVAFDYDDGRDSVAIYLDGRELVVGATTAPQFAGLKSRDRMRALLFHHFEGRFDEVRLAQQSRSAAWYALAYHAMNTFAEVLSAERR